MASSYIPRVADGIVSRSLEIAGALLVEGARACGKTETGRHHSASSIRLDIDDDALELALVDPSLILEGATPRLIDEWQLAPRVWNHIRKTVDDRRAPGQFILTGSAVPADDVTRHSGAGRILRVRLRPMTLFESGHSTGEVSLSALLAGERAAGRSELDVRAMADRICVGGWPGFIDRSPEAAQVLLRSYLEDLTRVDIPASGDTARRDPVRVGRLLASYGRHVGTSAALSVIAADTGAQDSQPIKSETAREYVSALQRVMVVEEQPSWAPHLRSRDTVRQAAVRHFVDPSLAIAALNGSPSRLLTDMNTFGLLFESLVVRDLRVYAQLLDGEIRHYRDSAGHEADAVIQLRDGRWALVEVKLGRNKADEAAESLLKLKEKIDTSKVGDPAALVVVTGDGYAHTRPDGVHVVPVGTLAP